MQKIEQSGCFATEKQNACYICIMCNHNETQLVDAYFKQKWMTSFKNLIPVTGKYSTKFSPNNYVHIYYVDEHSFCVKMDYYRYFSSPIRFCRDYNWHNFVQCLNASNTEKGCNVIDQYLLNIRLRYVENAKTKLFFTTLHDFFRTMNHEQLLQITNWSHIDKILFDPYLFANVANFF